jgi:hypothetical protein
MHGTTAALLLLLGGAIPGGVAAAQSAPAPFTSPATSMRPSRTAPLLASVPAAAAYRIALRREIRRAASGSREGGILMIVGVAGLVTGLVVHEDLVTIAGAGVGGYGLYLYLRATR